MQFACSRPHCRRVNARKSDETTLLIPHLRQALLLFQNKQHNCFLYLKICNLLFDQPGKPRLKSYANRCHISVGTHKFRSAVLVSGVPFRNQRWRNLNMFCRVNQADRAQNCRHVYQNFGVPCPKWTSCKCSYRLYYLRKNIYSNAN